MPLDSNDRPTDDSRVTCVRFKPENDRASERQTEGCLHIYVSSTKETERSERTRVDRAKAPSHRLLLPLPRSVVAAIRYIPATKRNDRSQSTRPTTDRPTLPSKRGAETTERAKEPSWSKFANEKERNVRSVGRSLFRRRSLTAFESDVREFCGNSNDSSKARRNREKAFLLVSHSTDSGLTFSPNDGNSRQRPIDMNCV